MRATGRPIARESAAGSTSRLLAAAVAAALVASPRAQLQFDTLAKRSLPELKATAQAMAVGDVDGDGTVDLVLGIRLGQNRLCLGNGDGTFRDETGLRMPVDGDDTRAVALGGVDGDGDLVFGRRPPLRASAAIRPDAADALHEHHPRRRDPLTPRVSSASPP